MKELNKIFSHVYVCYFIILCSIYNIIMYPFNSVLNILMVFISLWALALSSSVLYKYHIKKEIDIRGDPIK